MTGCCSRKPSRCRSGTALAAPCQETLTRLSSRSRLTTRPLSRVSATSWRSPLQNRFLHLVRVAKDLLVSVEGTRHDAHTRSASWYSRISSVSPPKAMYRAIVWSGYQNRFFKQLSAELGEPDRAGSTQLSPRPKIVRRSNTTPTRAVHSLPHRCRECHIRVACLQYIAIALSESPSSYEFTESSRQAHLRYQKR